MKERIVELLKTVNRSGVDRLIENMESMGFFEAPCSTQYHLSKPGGLAEHSYNVYCVAKDICFLMQPDGEPLSRELEESLIIICLLHDFGKVGQFSKPNYIPNMLKGRATKANPDPEPIQSTSKPYKSNPDLMYVDHEIRSVILAEECIELTEEEQQAILWHNGLYGTFKYQIQGKEFPLYLILHFADIWASRVIEKDGENDEI